MQPAAQQEVRRTDVSETARKMKHAGKVERRMSVPPTFLASFRAPLVGFVWSVTFVQLSCAKWAGCLLLLSLDKAKSKHAAEGFLNGS